MLDFTALQNRAAADPDRIQRELDPRYVLHVHGHQPAACEAGRWLYHSPFRPDDSPSYTVRRLEDGRYRCGDLARGQEGDVLDLLRELLPGEEFSALLLYARDALHGQQVSGWAPPTLTAAPAAAPIEERVVEVIRTAPLEALSAFLHSRTGCLRHVPSVFLRNTYGVAEIGPDLLIPYTRPDGSIAALKRRNAGEGTKSLPGYRYGELLYGAHLLTMHPDLPVLLCEGETDTWAAAWHTPNAIAVGLPSGAQGPLSPVQLELVRHRQVRVCFDADPAGDAAAEKWLEVLSHGSRTRPPEGRDLASLTTEEILQCLT